MEQIISFGVDPFSEEDDLCALKQTRINKICSACKNAENLPTYQVYMCFALLNTW